ncbi:MAG: hypothetical protein KJO34_12805 [Deltaproteobacteria bacterium]|nr:hypothetical protein [Deltaproteobacteria bacterium]
MPLAFDSLSHGTITFGFFNIESDMLLLDHYFFFASDFCKYAGEIVEWNAEEPYEVLWPVQLIEAPEDIGDLMGAIHGIHFTGFIGELYRHFPFPKRAVDFKQNPAGFQTQSIVADIIAKFAEYQKISVAISNEKLEIAIGILRFNRFQFQELIKYVWRGGFPRWKDEIRPDYVTQLKNKIVQNPRGLFSNMTLENSSNNG